MLNSSNLLTYIVCIENRNTNILVSRRMQKLSKRGILRANKGNP